MCITGTMAVYHRDHGRVFDISFCILTCFVVGWHLGLGPSTRIDMVVLQMQRAFSAVKSHWCHHCSLLYQGQADALGMCRLFTTSQNGVKGWSKYSLVNR